MKAKLISLALVSSFVSMSLFIFGLLVDDFYLRIFSKPVPVFALMGLVWFSLPKERSKRGFYRKVILAGLFFCVIGDILLEFRSRFFLGGMIAFLLGHVCYIIAFVNRCKKLAPAAAVIFLVWILWVLQLLWGNLGALQIPVAVYTMAIFVMMWRSAVVLENVSSLKKDWPAFAAVLGAVLFGFSDTLIALDKFNAPIEGVRVPIILTYWLGQLGISLSVYHSEALAESSTQRT